MAAVAPRLVNLTQQHFASCSLLESLSTPRPQKKMAVPALKVGFIGSGKMATALAKGFVQGK